MAESSRDRFSGDIGAVVCKAGEMLPTRMTLWFLILFFSIRDTELTVLFLASAHERLGAPRLMKKVAWEKLFKYVRPV